MSKSTDEILSKLLLPDNSDWEITSIDTDDLNEEIHVILRYTKSVVTIAGREFPIYDYRHERNWRHLDLWQYKTYLTARIPRYNLFDKIVSIDVPWSCEHSRLTELMKKK